MSPFFSPSSTLEPLPTAAARSLFLTLVFLSTFAACTPPLYTREQLLGAEPSRDLAAVPLLSQLSSLRSHQISLRGVRLGDPLDRALRLWGASSYGSQDKHVWLDTDGLFLLRVQLRYKYIPPTPSKPGSLQKVIGAIEIFAAYRDQLHPGNQPLLSLDSLRNPAWRSATFRSPHLIRKEDLLQRITYPERGFALVLFSELTPTYKQNPVVFRLFAAPLPAS